MWRGRGWRQGKGACLGSSHLLEDTQPVAQEPWREEVLAHVLLPCAPQLLAEVGVAQELECALGALLGGRHEVAGRAVLHLERDAPYVAADEGARLPERLGDGQPEALTGRFLDHDVGLRLERV